MKGKLKKLTAVILSIALLGSAGLFTGLTAFAAIPEGGYTIGVDETIDIEVAGNNDIYTSFTFIKFVPQESGTYVVYSSNAIGTGGSTDTYGYIFPENHTKESDYLAKDDDSGEGNNFKITYTFTAGTVYWIGARFFTSSNSGTMSVTVTHQHYDANDDGVCDVEGCGYVIWTVINENQNVTVDITDYSRLFGRFTPEEDGYYEVKITNMTAGNDVYGYFTYPDGEYVNYEYNGDALVYFLEGGVTYSVYLYSNYESASVRASVKSTHLHADENEDGICDVADCGFVLWERIYENVPFDTTIARGESYNDDGVFIPSADGLYEFSAVNNTNKDEVTVYVYNYGSDSYPDYTDNGGVYAFSLEAGKKYALEIYRSAPPERKLNVTVTAKATHLHADENEDGICDVAGCGFRFWNIIEPNVPVTVKVSVDHSDYGEALAGIFTPAETGYFDVTAEMSSTPYFLREFNYDVRVADASTGNDASTALNDGLRVFYLEKGKKYRILPYFYDSWGDDFTASEDVTVTVKPTHLHTDEDNDGICDVEGCGYTFWIILTEGVPADVTLDRDEKMVAYFTPENNGVYEVKAVNKKTGGVVYGGFEAEDGGYISGEDNGSNYAYTLQAGVKYAVELYDPFFEDEAVVTVTAVSTHIHTDTNEDGICDVEGCGYVFWATLTEDVTAEFTIEAGSSFYAYFTPDRNDNFVFETSEGSYNFYVYCDGSSVNSSLRDNFNNGEIYSLESGKKYELRFHNYSTPFAPAGRTEVQVTATHAHYSSTDPEVVVAPTAGASGVNKITCDKCGKDIYGVVYHDINSQPRIAGDFIYLNQGNQEAVIVAYTGSETEIVIPATVDGVPVTAIGSYYGSEGVFNANPAITSIVIPEGVQSINKYAFAGLTGLKQVTIPDSVAVIDDDAFRFCTSLDTVTIGNGVKYIGDGAFTVVPTDENKKMYAGQLEFMQQMMESQRGYYEAYLEEINDSQEGYFEDVSDQLGTEVTSWQDIYDFVDGLTDEEAQNKLGISKDEYKNEIKEVENSYKLAVAEMQSELDYYNNMPAFVQNAMEVEESPLERVMYAGSEEDWNAIAMGKGNEALNEAPIRTFNGQGLYYATFVADGKEVAKVTFTSGQASVAEPAVPAKAGYTGKWEAYTLGNADITVNAVYTKIAVYTATFTVDGKVVKKANVAAGAKIPVPPAPTKDGYTFKGWSPKVPAKMPAKNMTFKAVFEQSAAKVTFEKSASVSYRTKVTITATGENLPKGTVLAIYEKGGSKPLAKGSAKSVSYEAGEMKSAKTYEVKVIDSKGNAQKGLGGEIKIDVTGTGFFQRIIAFFKYLFSPVPTKTVGPKVK